MTAFLLEDRPSGAGGMGRSGLRAVVVGAGLAGLACAGDLLAAGAAVRVLEASDGVGGRMRTDPREGFLLDRGFQVFNTSYPQVRRRSPARPAPAPLHPGHPGAHRPRAGAVRRPHPAPRRRPTVAGRLAGPRDLAALALLSGRDVLVPAAGRHRGTTTRTALAARASPRSWSSSSSGPSCPGCSWRRAGDLQPLLPPGVAEHAARHPLPAPAGIGAVPEQLAAELPPGTVRLETPVSA